MTELNQVYKCNICGNMVEVLHTGKGELVCCGQPMELLVPKTVDTGREKHLPVIERIADGYLVKVGSVAHPMEEKHSIQWIELIADGRVYRQVLQPGQLPEAKFCVQAERVIAREYCNLHGVWQSEA